MKVEWHKHVTNKVPCSFFNLKMQNLKSKSNYKKKIFSKFFFVNLQKKKCSEKKKSALKLCAKYFPPKIQNKFVKNKLKRCFEIVCKTPVFKKTVRNIFLCKNGISRFAIALMTPKLYQILFFIIHIFWLIAINTVYCCYQSEIRI